MKKFQGKRLQKKWLGLMLTAVMLTSVLGGCGKADSDSAPAVEDGTSGNAGAANDTGENFYGDAGEASYDDVEAESGQYTDDVVSSADMGDAYNSSADRVAGGFAGTAEKSMEYDPYSEYPLPEEYSVSPPDTEEYHALEELGFMAASVNPLSTFSADVDTASYSNLRRMIEDGYGLKDIPEGAVRIEELLNYFHYDYAKPKQGEPFGVTTQIADCPWNANTKIAMIGLKTQDIDFSEAPASNLVFLLDVSGSMYSEDKLPLLQKSFSMLTENLTAKDRVSIVTYAGEDKVILEGVQGTEQKEIIDALDALEAGGSTAGSAGIITAYSIAEKYFIKGGNNRIILATDGDLNVGLTTEEELEALISEKKESGVYLSVLGFGTGNIKDNKMEILADKGNGNYAYIDSLNEAKKVLVEELGATFVTVAEDVKFQVEFNPDVVAGYRLIGYENRQLAEQDFADDTKDAGEIGAGHSVTVLYEIVTTDAAATYAGTSLKYADKKKLPDEEWFTVNIRYKKPGTQKSLLLSYPVDKADYKKEASQDMQFAMAVAEFGLVVNDSSYKGDATIRTVIDRLKEIDTKSDEYKDEFCYLVRRLEKN